MGYRRDPFVIGEWYHCYNRGIDKRDVFESEYDCERFLQALYLSNNSERTNRKDFEHFSHRRIFSLERSVPIVVIGAYCLMPNHFHLLIQEITEGGITKFMHKVGTSYTMYFNEKNDRVGNLFYKPFRSKLVSSDAHFKYLPTYIHANPVELFEPEWRNAVAKGKTNALQDKLNGYRFSSYPEYRGEDRIESSILDKSAISLFKEHSGKPLELLEDAAIYLDPSRT